MVRPPPARLRELAVAGRVHPPPARAGAAQERAGAHLIAVLWDLDGTLVDSAGDIAAALDRMLVASGLPALGEARVRSFVGDGARHLVTRCVTAAGGQFDEGHLARFLSEYRAHVADRTVVFPAELRGLLPEIAAPMAVVTNKPEGLSAAILAALGLEGAFGALIGGDTLPTRKPDPAPLREAMRRLGVDAAVMVGDGPQDVGAARAAGLPMIGVGWGIHAPVGAPVVVDDVAALRRALSDLGVPFR